MFENNKKKIPQYKTTQYNRRHLDYDLQKEIKNGIVWHDNAGCSTGTSQFWSFWFDLNLSLGSCLSYILRIETGTLELWGNKATCCVTLPPRPSYALLNCKSHQMTKCKRDTIQRLKMHESTRCKHTSNALTHLNTPCRTCYWPEYLNISGVLGETDVQLCYSRTEKPS